MEVSIVSNKSKKSTYTLTLPLKTEKFQEDIINRRLEISRNIYNSVLGIALKRYNLMLESKEYRKLKKELNCTSKQYHECRIKKDKKELDKARKKLYKDLNNIYLKYGLTQYSLYEDVKPMYKHFKDNIGSLEAQAIVDRVYEAIEKLLSGDKVKFKKYSEVNSIENKWNKSGLRYREENNIITWGRLSIPVIIKNSDMYAQKALLDRVKYIRIIRKFVRNKYKFYVQIIMEGIPPIKVNKQTGKIKNSIGSGDVGVDIGTQTIAIASKYDVKLLELCPEVDNIEKEKRILQRKLDRQRRVNNPDNFNEDGTIKKGIRVDGKLTRLKWNESNKYIKTRNKLREIQRKQADIRKQSHEKLANYIIGLGDRIFVEVMNYKGLQARAKRTTVNEKTGRINKKKRFGRSLAIKAPAMLLDIIDRKLKYNNLVLLKVNTCKIKASQYNHFTDEYNKKELKDRWNNDTEIQRDMYSAFLIKNINEDLETINRELCFERYENFKKLHDKEIKRLKELKVNGAKLISSMGI